MLLADSMAGARQVQTPIRSKSGTRKTACLDLTSGPQPLWRSGKHVVKSDLAPPAPYSLGTYIGSHVHMEPFSMYTWNLSPLACKPHNHTFWFAHGLQNVYIFCSWERIQGLPGRESQPQQSPVARERREEPCQWMDSMNFNLFES